MFRVFQHSVMDFAQLTAVCLALGVIAAGIVLTRVPPRGSVAAVISVVPFGGLALAGVFC